MNRLAQGIAWFLLAAAIFMAGFVTEGWRKDAEIADLNAERKAADARATQAAIGRLASANRLADDLQTRLAAAESAREQITQEKDLAIRRLTVGRRCLDSAVVRVLNRTASLKPAAVPEAASEPDGADAAFATDTDVGLWIGQCQRGYETCRGRLSAVADFFEGLPVE